MFYHDSHSVPIPPFAESEGLFAAIENAILKAKDYIYIVAYSFWPEIRLRREENSLILGDILKQKAREGVEVKILLWREIF